MFSGITLNLVFPLIRVIKLQNRGKPTSTWYCDVSCMIKLELEYFFLCSVERKTEELSIWKQRVFPLVHR